MVHALEEIRRLLKPEGRLIDIHPIREAPFIRVYRGHSMVFEESDPGYDYDEGLQHADEVLADVVGRGLYHVEGKNEFELVTYASAAGELRDYWVKYGAFDDTPKDEAMIARRNDMYARADEIMQKAKQAEITYHERARITQLRPTTRT